jgi:hypothetical protein
VLPFFVSLVRPHLEYASSVWDPYLQKHIYQIEMVQRRAARFIKHEYSRDPGIVTSILQELELQALPERRKTSRLVKMNLTSFLHGNRRDIHHHNIDNLINTKD